MDLFCLFTHQSFYPEPNAAALSYLHAHPGLSTRTLLAVDFGGGTLDLCVIKHTHDDFEVVATHGIGLGGDHIDQLLFRELIFPLLGKGERWRRKGEDREIETAFPFEEYEDLLLNWAVSYMLNQNKYTTPLHQRIQDGDAASHKFQRLYDLIKNNHSYLVFQLLKDLKAELSHAESAKLDIPELDIELTLTRERFEQLIEGLMQKMPIRWENRRPFPNRKNLLLTLVLTEAHFCAKLRQGVRVLVLNRLFHTHEIVLNFLVI